MNSQVTLPKKNSDEITSYLGMLIAIGSITMMFVTLFVIYSVIRIRTGFWLKPGTGSLPIIIGIINTTILLISSWTYSKGFKAAKLNDATVQKRWTGWTLVLGILFLVMQVNLWRILIESGFTIQSGIISSVFYMLTGIHGLHIVAGVIAVAWVFFRVIPSGNLLRTKLVGIFWHFLDVLWICLFIAVFII